MKTHIQENTLRVQERIAAACQRSGRRPEDVKLVAVSKTITAEKVREAYDAGLRDFGENRVQEAKAKRAALLDFDITWHLIGHLQTNKARVAREIFSWVHSVDSLRVAQKLDDAHPRLLEERLPILLEVNLGGESSKSGIQEEQVLMLAEQMSLLPTLELRGLMVLPPFFDNPEQIRPFFRRLRELAASVRSARLPNVGMQELSMGMSHDFEIAVEEGATIVRVGTAIFGPRG